MDEKEDTSGEHHHEHAAEHHEAGHEHHSEGHEHHETQHEHAHEHAEHVHTDKPAVVKEKPKAEKPAHHAAKAAHKKKPAHKAAEKHHEEKAAPKNMGYMPYVIGGIILIVIIALIIRFSSGPAPATVDNPSQFGSVDMTFHVMSQCPYGIQVENAIEPVLNELGDNINFRLEFIGGETDTGFDSLHGQAEVEGDIVQLCVQKYYPKDLIDFVVCQNKDPRDFKGSIDKCAKDTAIDAAKINACADGEEGKSLMSESIAKSDAAGAQGSPTIFVNSKSYMSGRDSNAFKRAVCAELKPGHPACEGIPACSSDADCSGEPGKVGVCESPGKKEAKCTYVDDEKITLTVLNSKDCKSCDTSQLLVALDNVFMNMEVKQVEASSTEGKALIRQYSLEKAPSFIFSAGLDKTYAWSKNANMQGAFRKSGTSFVLIDDASGANYILDPVKRAEMEELIGVKKGDNKPQIDFYVMSYCPYGNQAEEGIEPAYQLLKNKADFNPHYVIYSNYQGGGKQYCMDDASKYCSMHGVQEMNQGIRELCVHKLMGDAAYFKFVLEMNKKCSSANADTCWEAVAKTAGIDVAKVKSCFDNDGLAMAESELQLNKALGVQGSPTVFVEGEAYSGGRTPASYAQALCAAFETAPSECSASSLATLGAASPASAAPAAGGCG